MGVEERGADAAVGLPVPAPVPILRFMAPDIESVPELDELRIEAPELQPPPEVELRPIEPPPGEAAPRGPSVAIEPPSREPAGDWPHDSRIDAPYTDSAPSAQSIARLKGVSTSPGSTSETRTPKA